MFRGQRLEAIDTRWVFRVYAATAGLAGLLLVNWGPMWFGAHLVDLPWGKAALIRVLGSIVIAAACCAAGFAAIDNPQDRRRSLLWFIAAHTAIWLVVLTQRTAIWGPGLADKVVVLLWVCICSLFLSWAKSEGDFDRGTALTTLFSGPAPNAGERLRSRYEQQIREAARQEERNRLARDLHDSVKQQIFVIQTAAATVQARFESDQAGARQALEQVRLSAREAVTEMQAMLDQLRATPLENAGLIESLKKQCEALGFRTGARVEVDIGKLPLAESLPPGSHEAILRVAQEALANIGRHARATSVLLSLSSGFGIIDLRIRDDGAGFDTNQAGRGQGIRNMHARAEEFGGRLELISRPGAGSTVAFSIPYTTSDSPRTYLRRAVYWGIGMMMQVPFLTNPGGTIYYAVEATCAIMLTRYVIAWRRALRRRGAQR